jgi:DNA-binding MarR family transcriptional regulator
MTSTADATADRLADLTAAPGGTDGAPAGDGSERLSGLLAAVRQVKVLWADVSRSTFPAGSSGTGVLHLLDQQGPQRVSDLALCAHVGVSTMSRHVADLTSAGLLDRELDAADGRTHLVRLTTAGSAELARARQAVLDRLRRAIDGWTAEELDTLTGQLTRLATDIATHIDATGRSLERT